MAQFTEFLNGKSWSGPKPGLLNTFDDGLRSQFEVVLPLVEKYGFSACFMVPSAFLDGIPDRASLPDYAGPIDPDESV